ncbi:MAG: hypothetical protein GXY33_22355 [Phycisphaerae bacterium]|nr:hypothetical protein [Phycisphaerae bacterium]
MTQDRMLDRLWLWGMKVNALQEASDYAQLQFGKSALTTEEAVRRTGIRNVIVAGHLPIDRATLDSIPSAKRFICKTSIHKGSGGTFELDPEDTLAKLRATKQLALADPRVEAFHIDDFSTGSIDAGVRPEHLTRLQFANAVEQPQLPLGGTIYTMSLDRPELPGLLPFFAHLLVPLWHAEQIDTVPAALDRLADLSGGKPVLLCLYVYDFGTGKHIPADLMKRHLDLAEQLIREQRVTGMCMCGTCMMDLPWDANRCYFEWIERVGNERM